MTDATNERTERTPPQEPAEATPVEPGRRRFLRKRRWWCGLAAVPFLLSCVGALALWAIFAWPRVNWFTYFFIVRPPLIWFGALVPGLIIGAVGVRRRWLIAGCAIWLITFAGPEEVLPWLRLSSSGARQSFADAHFAYSAFMEDADRIPSELDLPIRIVTWNVAAGRFAGEEAVTILAEHEPDIVLLQEYRWGSKSRIAAPLIESDQFRGYQHHEAPQAVFSRWPVEVLPSPYLSPYNCRIYRVQVTPEHALILINVHLSRPVLKTQLLKGWTPESLRREIAHTQGELDALDRTVDEYEQDGTVIIAGDFNLPPTYPPLDAFRERHGDCFAERGSGWGKTAPTLWRGRRIPPMMRVDMIWAPRGSQVYYCRAYCNAASDHALVLAEVSVPMRPLADSLQTKEEKTDRPTDAGDGDI